METQPRTARTSEPGARPWWLLALVFAGGLLAGVLVVALLGLGTPNFQAYRDTGAVAVPPGSPTPQPSTGSAEVNAACLRVINEAQDIQLILGNVEQVRSDGDIQLIDDLIRQLQPIERRLADDLAACRVTAATAGPSPSASSTPGGSATATPSPTPSPTAS